jgi:hypothetical protein
MDDFEDNGFKPTTYQTDCLETDALSLKNLRQLQLGKDLGIYIREKDGTISSRIDAVAKGEPKSLAMYDAEFNVVAIPWAKHEERRHPKTGKTVKQLSLDGAVRATDVFTSDDVAIDDKLNKVSSDLHEVKTMLTSDIQSLLRNISTLTSELSELKNKLQSIERVASDRKSSLSIESTDPNEATKWSFKASQENDGRPSLQVMYEGETTSKFMGTPNSMRRQNQSGSSTPTRTEPSDLSQEFYQPQDIQQHTPTDQTSKPTKQKMSVTLRTPSEKKGNRSADKVSRTVTQVETVNLNRLPRSQQDS